MSHHPGGVPLKQSFFLLIFILLLGPLAAEDSAGDQAFLIGAYDQAEAYYQAQLDKTTESAARRRVLLKLMGVAQARHDMAAIWKFGSQLEEALKGQDDPEVAMRMHLIRGVTAVRTLDPQAAASSFSQARPLAEKLYRQGDPGGALGLAECNSYDYLGPIFIVGQPTPLEYQQACFEAYQPSIVLPASAAKPLWLMDVTRTVSWNRIWIWKAWEYFFLAYREGEQQLANQWAETSYGIGSVSLQSLQQSFQATQNLELLTGYVHVAFELTDAFPIAPWASTLLDGVASYFPKWPETAEKSHVQGRYHRSKARAAVALKKPDEALDHYLKSAEFFSRGKRRLDEMDILVEMGYVHLLDSADSPRWRQEVPGKLEQMLSLTDKIHYPLGRYYALGFLGTIRAREGNPQSAERLLKDALQQLMDWSRNETPQARAQKLNRPEVRLFSDTLVEVLLEQDKQAEAADTIGMMGRVAETAGVDLARLKGKTPQTTGRLRSLEKNLRKRGQLVVQLQSAQSQGDEPTAQRLSQQLADNRADFQKTVNNIRRDDPDFERMVSVRPSSFAKLQSVLPDDVVVVAYYPSQAKTMIFAATKEKLHVYSSDLGREDLDRLVGQSRRSLTSRQSADGALSELYQALIAPLDPLLADKNVLAVVPSGTLYYLPFAALKQDGGKPLADKVGVALLTATELPDVGSFGTRPKPSRFLALANPDGTLPGARDEVEKIAPLFAQQHAYFGPEATQDKLKGKDEVIHFATHGVLDTQDVNESYLLLSGADNRLTVGEIYGLDLAEVTLVTLSACETAVGELNPGAEIATLSQAFSVAGSKTMLGSLWKVDDEATATLMGSFYRHLTEGKSKADSLRLAQLETAAEARFESPFFWSGFVLIGDWR